MQQGAAKVREKSTRLGVQTQVPVLPARLQSAHTAQALLDAGRYSVCDKEESQAAVSAFARWSVTETGPSEPRCASAEGLDLGAPGGVGL